MEGNASVLTLCREHPLAISRAVCSLLAITGALMTVRWSLGCTAPLPLRTVFYTRCDRKPQQQPPLVGSATLITPLLPYPTVCSFILSFLSSLPLAESQWWSGRYSHEKCPCACVLSPTGGKGPNYEGTLFPLTMQSRKGTWNKQRIWVTKSAVFATICILLTLYIPNSVFHFLFLNGGL